MARFCVYLRGPNNQVTPVNIEAASLDEAVQQLSAAGSQVDQAQTQEEARLARYHRPGLACQRAGLWLLAMTPVFGGPASIAAAVVLGALAMEQSKGRRGLMVIIAAFVVGVVIAFASPELWIGFGSRPRS